MTLFGGVKPSSASQQTQQTTTFRVLSYQYGNGYESRIPDGANPQKDTWTITFDNLNSTDSTSLQTWLTANPPWVTFTGDGTILSSTKTYWITKNGYQVTPLPGNNVNSFQFSIEQVY